MTKANLQIHSENILPIIKKWLYSDRDIFVRELVSNACDAISKLKILANQGQAQLTEEEFRINIQIDKDNHTLKFSDNGIGMDAEEVTQYIAQIAFSGAEDFVNKYKTEDESKQFIGHFGLGFYSAYMVADKVDIQTLSYKSDSEPVFWSCDGSSEYVIEKGERTSRGTDIILHISKEHEEFLDAHHLKKTLQHYCGFLPYSIYLNDEKINEKEPLWIKGPSECNQQDYLEFYRHLYPMQEDPLFWVHLNVDYPFHLKGILYFPKINRDFDANKQAIKLYCNRVFVSDNCKDILPNYLIALQGIIDSPDIPLNVSRSYLQMDRTVRQLSGHISKKVADSLTNLYRTEKDRFIQSWQDISFVVKLGAIEDEKFYQRVKEILIWKNTQGEWTTVEDYLERNKETTKEKILYTNDEHFSSHFLDIYHQKKMEILLANSPIDSYLINFLEKQNSSFKFQRIDAGVEEILDSSREKTILDASGKSEAAHIADLIRKKLGNEKVEVEARSLASDSLPGFIVIEENQRRLREYMQMVDPKSGQHDFLKKTFVVNTNSPLVQIIQKMESTHPELAKEIAIEMYDLAMLSQKEMAHAALNQFIQRTSHIIEKLAESRTS